MDPRSPHHAGQARLPAGPLCRRAPRVRGPPGGALTRAKHFPKEGTLMRRLMLVAVLALAMMAVVTTPAWAGSPHFVSNTVTATRSGDSLTVSGKEAGLGDEAQVHIVVSDTPQCINEGSHHPQAGNKESVSAEGDFPVQNGKAEFSLTLTAVFQPDCSPPMTVAFTDVSVTDTTSGISRNLPGTF